MTDNVLNIDGQDYKETDLSDKQKYLINQLKDLTNKSNTLRGQLDQLQRAAESFRTELLASFKQTVDKSMEGTNG
jgi:hypothetical protein|tara:strand:- start:12 stop:236 length:225 start_codon:yes stop_codon:yes gene_type:complete